MTKPFLPPINEYLYNLEKIWESNILTNMGPLHVDLERELCSRFGCENVALFTNGHLALEIALKALNLEPGSEIITTPFTFVSTISSIVNQGHIPVFCDIDDDCTIDVDQIEALITPKTAAILPVHVYGFPCDVERIDEIARKHRLKVLYDAAHAFGVRVNGKDISQFGDISMFSFHATKLFHTIEGGALIFADSALKTNIDLYKNFGISGPETIELVGLNAKMNEFQAAMGLTVLPYLDEIIEQRKTIFERYMQNLDNIQGVSIFPCQDKNIDYNYAYVPILITTKRNEVFDVLAANNIHARKYFYPSLTKVECYRQYMRNNSTRKAETITEQVLALPIYPSLTFEQVDRVCRTIQEAI